MPRRAGSNLARIIHPSPVIHENDKPLIRVLHVEDDEHDALWFARALDRGRETFSLVHVRGLREAESALADGSFDVLVVALHLADTPPRAALEFIRQNPTLPTVVLTRAQGDECTSEALRVGAHDCFEKGEASGAMLRRSVATAVGRHKALERLSLRPIPGTAQQLIEDLRNQLTIAVLSLRAAREQLTADSTVRALHERAERAVSTAGVLTNAIDQVREGARRSSALEASSE
jgi:DNA-binding response OmpR family regulator